MLRRRLPSHAAGCTVVDCNRQEAVLHLKKTKKKATVMRRSRLTSLRRSHEGDDGGDTRHALRHRRTNKVTSFVFPSWKSLLPPQCRLQDDETVADLQVIKPQ